MRLAILFAIALSAPAAAQRTYWPTSVDTLAVGHAHHTHVSVTGKVTLVRRESDGDVHIKLSAPSGRFIVAECIPLLPCPTLPKVGDTATVEGVSRFDPEHGWYEVHPVERVRKP